jgi:hypothetical protein
MEIILQIQGGIGKSIIATAVCKAIKIQYPLAKLIVITAYPEVFKGNRNVAMALLPNENPYFYASHIQGQPDNKFFLHEPYTDTEFIQRRGHLIEVWCKMNGIKYNDELPELFITAKERAAMSATVQSPKPIMVIQTNGGLPNQTDKYSWPRDLPYATSQRIVNEFARDYNIFHIRRKDQLPLQNTYVATSDFRSLVALIMMSEKRLFIDSFAQHAAAAVGMPSVVCWVANVPSQFGYSMHTNIIANPPTVETDLRDSTFSKYNIADTPSQFPYNSDEEIFDPGKIIDALRGDRKQEEEVIKKKLKPEALETK